LPLRDLTSVDGYRSLNEGAKVQYEVEHGQKGPQTTNVTIVESSLRLVSTCIAVVVCLKSDSDLGSRQGACLSESGLASGRW